MQVGTPEQIYRRPQSRFVADFVPGGVIPAARVAHSSEAPGLASLFP